MSYTFIPSPNFYARGEGRDITAIVLHYTASMSLDGTLGWFQNPKAKASAHYVIGRDGTVIQMVHDRDIAWHAGGDAMLRGEPHVNSISLGIELVGTEDSGFEPAQLEALWLLLSVLVSRYRIPADRVVGHKDVLPAEKIDPDGLHGQFPWELARQIATAAFHTRNA